MGFFDFLSGKNPAAQYAQQAAGQISGIEVPDIESLKVQLQDLVQQGVITPEEAQAKLVEANAYDDINVDPQMRAAQMDALMGLQDVYQSGGLTAIDKARLQQIQDEQASFEKGQRGAIMTDRRRRGVGGSGEELAALIAAQQSGADRAGRAGLDVAAEAQRRALEAMMQSGKMGGEIEDRAYGQAAQKAAAANEIAKFNAGTQTQVNLANTAARNTAQAQNLGEKQRVADTNTQTQNQNRLRNSDLISQNYNMRLDKAKAVANALNGVGAAESQQQDRNAQLFGGLLGTAGQVAGSYWSPKKMAHGGKVREEDCYADGGMVEEVPGEPNVPGDSTQNDTVPAMLSPGELVVPRTQADDVEDMMKTLPRTQQKPSVEAVQLMLQALTGMGC